MGRGDQFKLYLIIRIAQRHHMSQHDRKRQDQRRGASAPLRLYGFRTSPSKRLLSSQTSVEFYDKVGSKVASAAGYQASDFLHSRSRIARRQRGSPRQGTDFTRRGCHPRARTHPFADDRIHTSRRDAALLPPGEELVVGG